MPHAMVLCTALAAAESDSGRGLKGILAAAGAAVPGDWPRGRHAAAGPDQLVSTLDARIPTSILLGTVATL